jgi:hypothetical protein
VHQLARRVVNTPTGFRRLLAPFVTITELISDIPWSTCAMISNLKISSTGLWSHALPTAIAEEAKCEKCSELISNAVKSVRSLTENFTKYSVVSQHFQNL